MRIATRSVVAALLLAAALVPANAETTYPNQIIHFIVPYAPGGLPDTVARIVGQHMQDRMGQTIVIENRAGGGAAAAAGALMNAPADGYTFIVTDGSIVSTNPVIFKKLTYNPKDIVPLALLGRTPLFLASNVSLPVKTLQEFVAYVKAHPGEINYGSSGVGSIHQISMEAMKSALHLDMTHIPYRGTGQSVPALMGGQVQVLFSAYPSLAGGVDTHKVVLLGNNGKGHWFQAPDVPPISDVIPGYDLATVVGLYGRPGLPRAVIDKISAEAIAAANSPEAEKQLRAAGIEPAGADAATLDKALDREIQKVAEVVKAAGIEPQ